MKHFVRHCAALFTLAVVLPLGSASAPAEQETGAAQEAQAPARDPFSPVGYSPVVRKASSSPAVEEKGPQGALQIGNMSPDQQARLREKLQVSGIMRTGADFVALVNDSLIGAGDTLEVDFEGQKLKLVVRAIDKESIRLEPAE